MSAPPPARSAPAARALSGRLRSGVRASPATPPTPRPPRPCARGRRDARRRPGHLALVARSWRASPSGLSGRIDTHVTGCRRRGRQARRHPLVLPPAHGSAAPAHASAPGSCSSTPAATTPWSGRTRPPQRWKRSAVELPHAAGAPGSWNSASRSPTSRPSGPTPSCSSSPERAGPRSRPTARPMCRRPRS